MPLDNVVICAETYPDELSSGLSEIVKHCPHQNFVTIESMVDTDGEKWRLKYVSPPFFFVLLLSFLFSNFQLYFYFYFTFHLISL